MKTCYVIAVLVLVLQVVMISSSVARSSHDNPHPRRSRRSLFQMCELIQRFTNRSCLDYYDYGCFCGLGNAGHGRKHLDDADGCCRLHDDCYGRVTCMWTYPQLVGYNVQCEDQGCECTDSEFWSPCARSVCECDLRFAECLGLADYHEHFRHYDWHLCSAPRAQHQT